MKLELDGDLALVRCRPALHGSSYRKVVGRQGIAPCLSPCKGESLLLQQRPIIGSSFPNPQLEWRLGLQRVSTEPLPQSESTDANPVEGVRGNLTHISANCNYRHRNSRWRRLLKLRPESLLDESPWGLSLSQAWGARRMRIG